MTDYKTLLQSFKKIENVLEQRFGAAGRGMHEKVLSVEHLLPQELVRRVRRIAYLRNKALHEDGFEIHDEASLLRRCNAIIDELQKMPIPQPLRPVIQAAAPAGGGGATKTYSLGPTHKGLRTAGLVAGLLVLLLMGYQFIQRTTFGNSSARTAEAAYVPAPAADPQSHPATKPGNAPSTKAFRRQQDSLAQSPKPAPEQRNSQAVQLPASEPAAPSSAKETLVLRKATIEYKNMGFSRKEPVILVTMTNNTGETVSSAHFRARMFINGEAEPLVTDENMLATFGEEGLLPGKTKTVMVYVLTIGDRTWTLPDALNARSRVIQMAVTRYADGRDREHTIPQSQSAPNWR